jgi:hypothetical protein
MTKPILIAFLAALAQAGAAHAQLAPLPPLPFPLLGPGCNCVSDLFNVNYSGQSATIILAGYRQGDGSLTISFEG